MSFVVHRAERADGLADALAEVLRTPLDDPFRAEVVAVHSRGIERWLTNRLATRLGTSAGRGDGICANLEFPFPGRLVDAALAAATGVDAATDPWQPERLAWPLLEVVDANVDEPWLAVLAGHIGGADPDAPDRDRRFAAVRHLADLYDSYAVHRPAMVRAWLAGADDDGEGTPLPADAAWQARLWRLLRDRIDQPSPPERLLAGCVALVDDPGLVPLPDRLSLFGLTRLPGSYLDVLCALAGHRQVHLLALHPSPGAWATIGAAATGGAVLGDRRSVAGPAPRSGGAQRGDAVPVAGDEPMAGDELLVGDERSVGDGADLVRHPLLRSWGRDSREMHIVLARRLAEVDGVEERHHAVPDGPGVRPGSGPLGSGPTTLLRRLQDDIRADRPPPGELPIGEGRVDERLVLDGFDASVQVHACHGRARQAEVVRDAIAHLLADDPTLEPRDIVVMCPDIDELAPLLRAAFEVGEPGDDEGSARSTRGATGPPGSGGTPGDDDRSVASSGAGGVPVIPFRLADRAIRQTNPVLGAVAELLALVDARLTASQVLTFAALPPVRERFRFDDDDLERLAGWVRASGIRWGLDAAHRRPYDLAAVDAGTWEAGLDRLLLGITMSEDGLPLVDGVLPLDDVDAGDIDLAGRLAELVGRLGDAVRQLSGSRPIGGWVVAIAEAAERLLRTRPADAWQHAQLDRLLRDVAAEAGSAAPGAPDGGWPDGGGPGGVPTSLADGPVLRLAEVRDLLASRLQGQPSRAAFRTGDLTMCTLVPMRSVPHRVVCLVGLDDGAFPRGRAPDGDDVLVRARHLGDHDRRSEDRQLLLDAVLAATDALVITYAGRDARTNEVLPPAVPVNELLDVIDRTARPDPAVRTEPGAAAAGTTVGPAARTARDLVVRHHPLQAADARCFEAGALGTHGPWSYDRHQLAGARAATGPRRRPGPFLPAPLPAPLRASPGTATIALDDLVTFVSHPVRAFLRQRLGISLRRFDDRPVDTMPVELDHLELWSVGDRILTGLLAGLTLDEVCEAEVARGLLPAGELGRTVLAEARRKASAVAAAARELAPDATGSLDVDVDLADGRRLLGTVGSVAGDLLRPTTYSRVRAKARLSAWVQLVAVTATHPDRPLRSVTIGSGRPEPDVAQLPVLGADADERRRRALAALEVLVDLRDRGLREPLPLFTATSEAWAVASRRGRPDPRGAAAREWTSGFNFDREDRDEEHRLVLGGVRTIDEVLAIPPAADEQGEGWVVDETTRVGRLARRLWDPVLAVTDPRPVTPSGSRTAPRRGAGSGSGSGSGRSAR